MKLNDWVEKMIGNVVNNQSKISANEIKKIIKENLKAFVQDREVVKIDIDGDGKVFIWVKEQYFY